MSRPGGQTQDVALIVSSARSGTTLLRLILDAHAEIACPAEAAVPMLVNHLWRVWSTIEADSADAVEGADLSPESKAAIRQAASAPMESCCARAGAHVYCDKSLDSVHYLEPMHRIYPGARYILMFRHVMDAVASGLDSSPWGFQAYGYLPYVQASPDNLVVALLNYWLVHVEKALAWERAHPEQCHRVRYEDLVLAPEATTAVVLRFLGVERDLSVLDRAFSGRPRGPGDHKIVYTSRVNTMSVECGRRIPVSLIPGPLLETANARLVDLGYDPLSEAWNSGSASRRTLDLGWGERLCALMRAVRVGPIEGRDVDWAFAIVVEEDDTLRWVVRPGLASVAQGEGAVDSVVIGTAENLVAMLSREENLGAMMRAGRIRHLAASKDVAPAALVETMRDILAVLGPEDEVTARQWQGE